jgi:soluble lytic murein transglycosylase-like protein
MALACVSGVAGADIYTFVDGDGTLHFTNVPSRDSRFKLYLRTRDRKGQRGGAASTSATHSADLPADRLERYDTFITEAATLYQIPEGLVRAVIKVESNYDPLAVSSVGARGLMQLMPETAERMQVRDTFDPRENIFGGVRYLRLLANLFNGDLQLTLAGYNAGEAAVLKYGGIPPYAETQDYVVRVLDFYQRYREAPGP